MEYALIVAILGLVVVLVVLLVSNSRERVEMAKINKAKDLGEVEYVFGAPGVEEEPEEDGVVDLADIPDIS